MTSSAASGAGGGASGGGGGGSGGSGTTTNTACAACKYQRRKCTPDCPLSPYFPPDQPRRFQNVHKLFGVSNILRILKHVDPSKRDDTVKSIAYEADTREKDPVHGCLGVITILQNQVSNLKDELAVARDQLFLLQQQQQQQNNFHQQVQMHQLVGSLGGSTAGNSAPQETSTTVLMQQLQQQYNSHDMDFATKSNNSQQQQQQHLPINTSSFEPDQYFRNDSFDIKPASTSRFDVGRYIRGESPVNQQQQQQQQQQHQQQQQQQLEAASVKPEQPEHHQHRSMHYGSVPESGNTFTDTTAGGQALMQSDVDHHTFDTSDRYAMAIRRRGSGLLNLTVASDAELRRAHHGVPEHELRSAGVYLTLTNN